MEILARDGSTKVQMLARFKRCGFYKKEDSKIFHLLNQLNAFQLDILSIATTNYVVKVLTEEEKCQ